MDQAADSSDVELVEACLRGKPEAWELLVRRYANLVYSVARRYRLDDDDAADVFQNTWSALWERLPEVRDHERLGSWLIRVSGRLSYQQIERRQRQQRYQQSDVDLELQPDSAPALEDLAVANEEATRARQALDQLPERCRRFLHYLFYDPTAPSYAEIARRLGVSPDTLGPLRGRCLRQLRLLLEQDAKS